MLFINLMMLCCQSDSGAFSFSDGLTLASLLLAFFLVGYQFWNDRRNIEVQWFKDLIIEPNIQTIEDFYKNTYAIRSEVQALTKISDQEEKNNRLRQIIGTVKALHSDFKIKLIELFDIADPELGRKAKVNLDKMVDEITFCLLSGKNESKMIEDKITQSKKELLSLIYKFKGA